MNSRNFAFGRFQEPKLRSLFTNFMARSVDFSLGRLKDLRFEATRGQALTDKQATDLQSLRQEILSAHSPHILKNPKIVELDAEIDLRSFHLLTYCKGEISGAIRLNVHCAEMRSAGLEPIVNASPGMIEITRLMARPGMGIGGLLMMKAGAFCIRQNLGNGFIALTQKKNLNLYQAFGMKHIETVILPERHSEPYMVLTAEFSRLAQNVAVHFARNII